jgi:ribosomal protein L21E
LKDLCAICGGEAEVADPTWKGPRVHLSCVLRGSARQPIPEKVEAPKNPQQFPNGCRVKVDHSMAKQDPWPELDGLVGEVIGSASFDHGYHASFVKFENGDEHKIQDRYLRAAEPDQLVVAQ